MVGEKFAVAAVAAGAQCPVEDVDARCDVLAAQHHFIYDTGLTTWPDATRGGSYRFHHALYQQVLYEQLGTARRERLDGRPAHGHRARRVGGNDRVGQKGKRPEYGAEGSACYRAPAISGSAKPARIIALGRRRSDRICQ